MSDFIRIEVPSGSFKAYVARPARFPAPSIVVVQEIFGINRDLRATCDELARQGYLAVCPDLFWRMEPDVEMNVLDEAEWKRGFDFYTRFDLDAGVHDLAATLAKARSLEGSTGKVGLMGFCLGGLMTYLTTARESGIAASVAYYPGATDQHLDEAAGVRSPMMIHLAGSDEYIPEPAQQQIAQAFADWNNVRILTYPGQNHAFARHAGVHYDADSARLANERTAAFLARYLS